MALIGFFSRFFAEKSAPRIDETWPTNPKGWLVQIKTVEHQKERVRWWIVAHPEWARAQEIATEAQGITASSENAHVRVLTIRVRREALPAEMDGLLQGAARLVEWTGGP